MASSDFPDPDLDPRDLLLGKALVDQELLPPENLRIALEYQSQLPARLEDILIKLDFIDEATLSAFLAEREHLPLVDLDARALDHELLAKIPRAVLEKHEVLPYRLEEGRVLLAMSDPSDYRAIEEIQFLTGCQVEPALAPRSAVRAQIERYTARLPKAPPPPPSPEEVLLARVADPAVAALARALLANGVVTAEEWEAGFDAED